MPGGDARRAIRRRIWDESIETGRHPPGQAQPASRDLGQYEEDAPTRAQVEQPIINITLQPDERRVFSVVEAAAILGIGRSKLYEFISSGEIRSIRIGRLRKIPIAAIDEFLASRESASRPPGP